MDQLKKILTLIAVILIALLLLAGIGFLSNLVFFLLLIAAGLGALKVFGFFRNPDDQKAPGTHPKQGVRKVQRLLEQYKSKQDH